MTTTPPGSLREQAHRIRRHVLEMAASPAGTHLGGSLSAADILTALYFAVLRVRPGEPGWPDRDYFVLSKGHCAAALYATLAERGYFPAEELTGYARAGSRLGGHPTRAVPGVEFATGSLGHGLSLVTGMCLAARRDGRRNLGYVLMGDGELQEGSVWEAAASAAFLELGNVVAVVDRNGLQINGSSTRRSGLERLAERWACLGWTVREVDGHDLAALVPALRPDPEATAPTVVLADTVKGKGIGFLENRVAGHYVRFSAAARQRALRQLEAGFAATTAALADADGHAGVSS